MGNLLDLVKEKDKVGLIYDSFKGVLMFELNGKLLESKLENIPLKYDLYWFVAKENYQVTMSIVPIKRPLV